MAEETAGSPEVGGSPSGSPDGSAGVASTPDWGSFKESLGDMGKDTALEPIKDFNGLTKSYIESQKMLGNSIRLPKKDANPEDRTKAVSDLLGRLTKEGIIEGAPESADKYEIAVPTVEGWSANEPLIGGFKQIAHGLGLPQSKAQALFDWYISFQEETETRQQVEFETMKADLKRELGGLYPRRMEAARRAAAKYMGADADKMISNLPPQVGKKIVMAFAEIGDNLLEDDIATGGIPGVTSYSDVEKKMNDIVGDKKHPVWDLSHPNHQKAVDEWTKLNKMLSQLKK